MKTGRRFIILTFLVATLIAILFSLPDDVGFLKILIGFVSIFILALFRISVGKWRTSLNQGEFVEIMVEKD